MDSFRPDKEGARRALGALDTARRTANPLVSEAIVSRYIDQRINDPCVPQLIALFLFSTWRAYLIRLSLNRSQDNRRWREAVKTTEDLLWSLRPKTDAGSRCRFFKILPQLYQQLHLGITYQGWGSKEQDHFFAALAKLHQAVLKL